VTIASTECWLGLRIIAPVQDALAYVAAALTGLWGIAHAVPTKQVVAGFGALSQDNRRVLTQEWLAEAVTMWGLAGLVIAVTVAAGGQSGTEWAYRLAAGLLLALGALTALTGARTAVVWFKICPVLLGTAAGLLLAASLV